MTNQTKLTEEQREEYDRYIENYDVYYDDEDYLEPAAYFAAMKEIMAILADYDKAKTMEDFSELDKKYDARLRQLERRLAV